MSTETPPARPSLLRRAYHWLRARMPVEPQSYWQQRHDALSGSLAAPGHADLEEEDNARDYAVRLERLKAAAAPFAPSEGETKRLLDAGCGTGLLFPVWQELGFEVSGIDFASAEARKGVGPGGVPVSLGDACELPEEPKQDLIVCIDVLFHVLDDRKWERFFVTAKAALAHGGRILVQEQWVDEDAYRGVDKHCHFRRPSDYAFAATRAGLALVSHERYELPASGVQEDILVYARDDYASTEDAPDTSSP